jgi:hypothetical protein
MCDVTGAESAMKDPAVNDDGMETPSNPFTNDPVTGPEIATFVATGEDTGASEAVSVTSKIALCEAGISIAAIFAACALVPVVVL